MNVLLCVVCRVLYVVYNPLKFTISVQRLATYICVYIYIYMYTYNYIYIYIYISVLVPRSLVAAAGGREQEGR